MGRPGITQQDVYNAAQKIAENGSFPTTQSVRTEIGAGSVSTIHKHLQLWKQERLLQPYARNQFSEDTLRMLELEEENANLKSRIQALNSKLQSVGGGNRSYIYGRLGALSRLVLYPIYRKPSKYKKEPLQELK